MAAHTVVKLVPAAVKFAPAAVAATTIRFRTVRT